MHLQCPRYACMKARKIMTVCTIYGTASILNMPNPRNQLENTLQITRHVGCHLASYVITRTQCQEDKMADAAEDIVTLKPYMHCYHTGI